MPGGSPATVSRSAGLISRTRWSEFINGAEVAPVAATDGSGERLRFLGLADASVTARPIVVGLTGTLVGLTAVLAVGGVVLHPVAFAVAAPVGAASCLLWYHAGGRRADRGRRSAARTGSTGRERDSGPAAEAMTEREAYETLGLDRTADGATIRRTYRERAKRLHPDGDDGDEEAFKRLNEAYEILTD